MDLPDYYISGQEPAGMLGLQTHKVFAPKLINMLVILKITNIKEFKRLLL